jgi:hypothetical protein
MKYLDGMKYLSLLKWHENKCSPKEKEWQRQ